ncbi:hypothetical protein ABIC32_000474 [Brevundimonas sp. 1080]|uniref:HNH endonuclease n=1 Tax=Brevundimonas sp. 1080 TaxID=3156405 RepID=UPI003395F24A
MERARGNLVAAEIEYLQRGPLKTLYEIVEAGDVGPGLVSAGEMEGLYTGTFSRKGTQSRDLYDKIKQGAPNGICPLCGSQQIKTLDHYLAKTKHPALTITPINLVPSCSDCNKAKGDSQAAADSDQHLHPYFDDVDDGEWLFATVVEASPPSLNYRADPPAAWPAPKRERVIAHFENLAHGFLFAALSSDQLPSMRTRLRRLLAAGGAQAVRNHLSEDLEGHKEERRNSWQIAMYAALVASDWYCGGGFDA